VIGTKGSGSGAGSTIGTAGSGSVGISGNSGCVNGAKVPGETSNNGTLFPLNVIDVISSVSVLVVEQAPNGPFAYVP
jgi:hypothetical protein